MSIHRNIAMAVAVVCCLLGPLSAQIGHAFGLGNIKVPDIKIPTLPHIPTLPGLGSLEHPTGDLAVAVIKFRGQAEDFGRGLVPSVNIPGIGPVNSLDSIGDKTLETGVGALDQAAAKLSEMTGLPIPSRGLLAPGVGSEFATALWESKRLKAACVLAGKSCGPLITRLAQAAVESSPTRPQFCRVMIGVANNRSGFGNGFNGTMTRNIHSLVPQTSPAAVDFNKPQCH